MIEISLTQGKSALIDDVDSDLAELKWRYRATRDPNKGYGLDNRRENLRLATNSQNLRNRGMQANNPSGYKGVRWHTTGHKWEAKIKGNGKQIYLGLFVDIKDAARAYNEAALLYHGEFAWLNSIGDE